MQMAGNFDHPIVIGSLGTVVPGSMTVFTYATQGPKSNVDRVFDDTLTRATKCISVGPRSC